MAKKQTESKQKFWIGLVAVILGIAGMWHSLTIQDCQADITFTQEVQGQEVINTISLPDGVASYLCAQEDFGNRIISLASPVLFFVGLPLAIRHFNSIV